MGLAHTSIPANGTLVYDGSTEEVGGKGKEEGEREEEKKKEEMEERISTGLSQFFDKAVNKVFNVMLVYVCVFRFCSCFAQHNVSNTKVRMAEFELRLNVASAFAEAKQCTICSTMQGSLRGWWSPKLTKGKKKRENKYLESTLLLARTIRRPRAISSPRTGRTRRHRLND
ncbi:hypothetical protein B296_00009107, partial [Ensete ventricosum]